MFWVSLRYSEQCGNNTERNFETTVFSGMTETLECISEGGCFVGDPHSLKISDYFFTQSVHLFNPYCLGLIQHLQGQALQYLV
jgi:hypothetical protein